MNRGPFHLVAFHESAHAVVGAVFNVPMTRLVISSSEVGETSHGPIPKPPGDPEAAEKIRALVGAKMYVAGPLAEWMFKGSNGSFLDVLRGIRSPHPWWGDIRCFNQCIEQSSAQREAVIAETTNLVTVYWDAIAEVAGAIEPRAEEALAAIERGLRLPDEPLLDILGEDLETFVSTSIHRVRENK